jgi:hypothetical protein
MDPRPGELCIGLTHPAFLASIVLGTIAALLLGGVLGKLERPRAGAVPNRMARNLAWFGALTAVFLVSAVVLQGLFSWLHPDLVLCTSVVGPYLFVPPVVLLVTGALRGVREARLPPIGAG